MEDSFGKVVAILICAYLMFIAPISYMQKETDKMLDTYLLNEIACFVEDVQNTGMISKERYDLFLNSVSNLEKEYKIELMHSIHSYDEEENVRFNSINFFTDEILEKINTDKIYYLKENDYFKVSLEQNNTPKLFYGGGIKNEAY